MIVQSRSLTSIFPYPHNTKRHPPEQIAKIAASITEYGFDQPIVVDGEGVIIKGHGRYQACLILGLDQVPCVVRTDLSTAQVRASRIADNRSAISDFDIEELQFELLELSDLGISLAPLGFDEAELLTLTDPNAGLVEATPRDIHNAGEPVIAYNIVFANDPDQQDFFRLVRHVRETYPERTIGEAMADFARDICDAA